MLAAEMYLGICEDELHSDEGAHVQWCSSQAENKGKVSTSVP